MALQRNPASKGKHPRPNNFFTTGLVIFGHSRPWGAWPAAVPTCPRTPPPSRRWTSLCAPCTARGVCKAGAADDPYDLGFVVASVSVGSWFRVAWGSGILGVALARLGGMMGGCALPRKAEALQGATHGWLPFSFRVTARNSNSNKHKPENPSDVQSNSTPLGCGSKIGQPQNGLPW